MSVSTLNWSFEPGSSPDANSCGISYAAGDTLYDTSTADNFPAGSVSKAIHDFITAHGWTHVACSTVGKYHYKSNTLADASAATEEKHILIDFTVSGKIYIRVGTAINADGSSITNPAYFSDTACGQMSAHTAGAATYAGKVWLGASSRHLVMQTYCNGVYGNTGSSGNLSGTGGPIGCFEVTRQAWDTVALGFSKFCFFANDIHGISYSPLVPPKTRHNAGTPANTFSRIVSLFGFGGSGFGATGFSPGAGFMPKAATAVDSKVQASNVLIMDYADTAAKNELIGHAFNLIALQGGLGAGIGDDIQIPVSADTNFGNHKFYDPDGTLESYWIIGSIGQAVSGANNNFRWAIPK